MEKARTLRKSQLGALMDLAERMDRMVHCPLNIQPKRKNRMFIDEKQSKWALKEAKQVKYCTKTERHRCLH